MSTKPLSYDSQKAVLQYMDANLRIQLSRKCPSLRVADKRVPLQIDHLTVGEMRTEINGTIYQLGLYRNYHSEESNKNGGSRKDLNQFGLVDHSAASTVTPGDVDLRSAHSAPYFMHATIAPEVTQPITYFIQLTIQSDKGETMEKVHYNRKLHEAMKYLNTVLIGGRQHEVQVNQLSLYDTHTIYRFPTGLKFMVKTIRSELIEYNKLDMIINPSSYSKINLAITNFPEIRNLYNQPAIKQAKSLTFDNDHEEASLTLFEILLGLETKLVTFRNEMDMVYSRVLAKRWLEGGKPVGSLYSFGFRNEKVAKMCLNLIKELNEEKVLRDQRRSVTFAMATGGSQLRAYYERILPIPKRSDLPWNGGLWNIVLKVEEI